MLKRNLPRVICHRVHSSIRRENENALKIKNNLEGLKDTPTCKPRSESVLYVPYLLESGLDYLISAIFARHRNHVANELIATPLRRPADKNQNVDGYRGTSLIRNTPSVGPYSSPMPRDL